MTGPDTTTTHWIKRLATLIHEIRPDWAEPGIASALTKVADRPLADVAIAAIQAATTRTDQRTPAIIAMDGSHWGTHGGNTGNSGNSLSKHRQDAAPAAGSQEMHRVRERWNQEQLSAKLDRIDRAEQALHRNCNPTLVFEVLLLKLFDCSPSLSPQA